MSSRCQLARLCSVFVVGVEVVVDDAGEAAFKRTQRFWFGGPGVKSFAVVGPSESVEADLGYRNAVQGSIELAVT
jgi:hypothetical protein